MSELTEFQLVFLRAIESSNRPYVAVLNQNPVVKSTLRELVRRGLLVCNLGRTTYSLTDAGRAALDHVREALKEEP